ncbi:MAG: isoaspartyl peptidase/L-asparaginase [Acidobacteriota bacterium]
MATLASSVAVVAHGGAASSVGASDGCRDATRLAIAKLTQGEPAIEAAIAGVVRLEDDGRFNAGSGAIYGLDGRTIEMDAAVMDSKGTLGAVACLSRVKNPILVASAVSRTPHCMLVGEGANRFAKVLDLPEFEGLRLQAQTHHRQVLQELLTHAPPTGRQSAASYRGLWNYPTSWDAAMKQHGHGTVGVVVRDRHGGFAVATSTGGCAPALMGRVGDTPLVGCGFYVGQMGAIAVTGVGEYIIRHMMAREVYQWLCEGMRLQDALDRAVALVPPDVSLGLIGVTELEAASSCNGEMAVDVST